MARRCPDGRWSAISSVYPEDCIEHMTVNMAVILVLLAILIILFVCSWAMSWEWASREANNKDRQYISKYGSTNVNGPPFVVYQVHNARGVPAQP